MALTRVELEQIATLARLKLEDADMQEVSAKLSGVIEFINQLREVDTTDVMPLAHPLDMSQRLRVDRITEHDQRDEFQRSASAVERGLYLVPKVLD